jgi:hypothetical protein
MSALNHRTVPLCMLALTLLIAGACSDSNPTNQTPVNAEPLNPPVPQCDPLLPAATRANNLTGHLRKHGVTDKDVDLQRGSDRAFQIEFIPDGERVIMRVKGKLAGAEQQGGAPPKPRMQDLLNEVDKYIKRGCADSLIFQGGDPMPGPTPSASPSGITTTFSRFDYVTCPFPQRPCSDGSCDCSKRTGGDESKLSGSNSPTSTSANTANAGASPASNKTP